MPAVLGVPLSTPVLGFSNTPVGKAPDTTLQVIGAVPEVTPKVNAYAALTFPVSGGVPEIVGGVGAVTVSMTF